MPDYFAASAAALRRDIAEREAGKAAAEARRATMIGGRAEALVVLTDPELDEYDAEIARLARAVERADAHLALLRPALAAAEIREADAAERERQAGERATINAQRRDAIARHGANSVEAKSFAQAALAASAPPVGRYNPTIFDPPAPVTTTVDLDAWHRDREARLRREGQPTALVARSLVTSVEMGRPNNADPLL